MRQSLALALAVLITTSVVAQTPSASRKPKAGRHSSSAPVSKTLRDLKEAISAQQQQIEQLQQQIQSRDQAIQQLQQQVSQAQAAAQQAQETANAAVPKAEDLDKQYMGSLQHDVADLKTVSSHTADELQETRKKMNGLSDLAYGKIKLGVTFFGDYTGYTSTGFGPQFITQANQPGPGNSGFNSFDVTRAYLNFFYTPNDAITLRVTPNIYRQVDGSSGSIADGTGAQIGGSTNGNLTVRLKYAYVDFNKLFASSKAFKKDKLTFGQTQNPLIDWEEGLSSYRYAYLMPWNYLSLSSTYVGVKLHGPIELNGKEYLDYDLGVFNTASFHAFETSDKKQVMGRLTVYPLGTTADRTGLGFTIFENYGYNTKFPDQKSTPLNRLAVLAHYQTHNKAYQIAGEYDWGRNAISTGNMFSGAGPVAVTPGDQYDAFSKLAGNVLSGTTKQQGFAFFGHARLGDTPFAAFGLYQHFLPNTNYVGKDPLDFARTVAGISYKVNKHFDFAVGDENYHYLQPQGLVPGGDTNAVAIWTQFNY
jgi:hypothetical protein